MTMQDRSCGARLLRWFGGMLMAAGVSSADPDGAPNHATIYDRSAGSSAIAESVVGAGQHAEVLLRGCEPGWLPTFGGGLGLSQEARAVAVFDDGSGDGPVLFVGGLFETAGGLTVDHIARWNGSTWSAVGGGLNGPVYALAVFDDGSGGGPALYAGGAFVFAGETPTNRIARWDGATWAPVGSGMSAAVNVLAVLDDGSGAGPALFAGGTFTTAGGVTARRIARWNGSTWSAVGTGFNDGSVNALAAFDDGSGPTIFAAGGFTRSPSGLLLNRIARWNGLSWSALAGGGMDGGVNALTVFDDGSGGGPGLYAAGFFTNAGSTAASRIARWDGASWSALGSGTSFTLQALSVFDDGSGTGPALYVAGNFSTAGGVAAAGVARWNGSAWSALGNGFSPWVYAFAHFDSGSGPELIAAGGFRFSGAIPVNNIARWDQSNWSALGAGMDAGVQALSGFDDGSGSGPALHVGGQFLNAGTINVNRVAKWDDSAWSTLGAGLGGAVLSLVVFDDGVGAGPALYAGGEFFSPVNRIGKWTGTAWSPLGTGANNTVHALAVFDHGSGKALYAGGEFVVAGSLSAPRIAAWNGSTWSALGSGVSGAVRALAVFDNDSGAGPALYVGGDFTTAGGATANRIARWNGVTWSALGSGMDGSVRALADFNDGSGSGPALYAGGDFTTAGGVAANRIAKWDGSSWSALGSGMNSSVLALTVFNDGAGGGPAVYAGGAFTTAGGVAADNIAKWNGSSWLPMGDGVNGSVRALTVFDDGSGSGPALYVGGFFTAGDSFIARWQGCPDAPACPADLSGDGAVNAGDLALLLGSWGASGGPTDLDNSGIVGAGDLAVLLGSWGPC